MQLNASCMRSTHEFTQREEYDSLDLTCLSIQLVTYLLLPAEESGLGLALHRIGYVQSDRNFIKKRCMVMEVSTLYPSTLIHP
jgi:hypothetical protein